MTDCPSTGRHGDARAYRDDRCRCHDARRDQWLQLKTYRLRRLRGERMRVDAIGVRRRLQALMVHGWPQTEIGRRMGVSNTQVSILLREVDWVLPRTHRAVAQVYTDLSTHPGPSRVAAGKARARGWLGPDWWDPDTIDDPRYDPVLEHEITRAELDTQERAHRALEVHRLTEAGWSVEAIAARIGTSSRTVNRYRGRWAS